MKWPVAHWPNSTWFWLELVGNCCERLKIIMNVQTSNFVSDLVVAGSFIHWFGLVGSISAGITALHTKFYHAQMSKASCGQHLFLFSILVVLRLEYSERMVSTLLGDVLVPCIARSSAAMILTVKWPCCSFPWERISTTSSISVLKNYRKYKHTFILFWTHWGRVSHICVSKLTSIGSDNGLSPAWRQAIIWINAGILLTGPLGTHLSEVLIKIHTFSFKKIHLKMSSGKLRPFVSASMCWINSAHTGSTTQAIFVSL